MLIHMPDPGVRVPSEVDKIQPMKRPINLTPRYLRRLLVLAPVFLMLPALHAREGCTNRDFNGKFGFFATGHVIQSPVTTLAGPFARVGRLEADGEGHVHFASTASFNGILIPQDFGGNVTVHSDCTFTAVVFLPDPFNLYVTFVGVVADGGNEIREFFVDPPGVLVYGTARKTGLDGCTDRNLSGSYLMELTGSSIQPPSNIRAPFAALGKIDTDGAGKLVGKLTSNFAGLAAREEPITGTYTVKPDCIFELKYYTSTEGTGPGNGVTLKGSMIDRGTGAFLLVLDPSNATVIGTLKLQ
jgi:hypothetical protein